MGKGGFWKQGECLVQYLYAGVFAFLFLALFPFWFFASRFQVFPERFRERFWPSHRRLQGGEGPTVWVHALSLGEMLSALPLVEAILAYRPDIRLVCTASTRSGMAAARKHLEGRVAAIRYFPLDHPFAVSRILDDLSPDLFVLVETDLWPFFMHALGKKGIPAIWVNARISDKTLRGYARLSFLMGPAMARFTAFFPQGPEDRRRLLRLGISEGSIRPWGNLKQDRPLPDPMSPDLADVRDWILRRGAAFLWICGSLHPGEEQGIGSVLADARMRHRDLLTLVVPRHPEKSQELKKRFREMGIDAGVFSENPDISVSILILDRLGVLADLYALGEGAFVGGSLIPLRGHNPLEAAMAGIPVMMGPHREDFAESFGGLEAAGGAVSVEGAEEILQLLFFWMDNPDLRKKAGEAGKTFCLQGRGTVVRILDCIVENLESGC